MSYVFEVFSPQPSTNGPVTAPAAGSGTWLTLMAIETVTMLVRLIVIGRRAKKARLKTA
ncbi:MAG TPA: hypothetical protein VJN21_09525 [Candidatus Acidoferrales bacterium]|nr:hypothetical protein [Candidatus Acidoferrales bacterium]